MRHFTPYQAFVTTRGGNANMLPPPAPLDQHESISNQNSTAIARMLPVLDDVVLAGGRVARALGKMKFAGDRRAESEAIYTQLA